MRESLGQEPLWNAGRRARPAGRAPHRKVRRLVNCAVPAFRFLFSFRLFVFVPRLIVMVSALHCRDDLTKVGLAVRFFGLACS
jgi:hypothetical protein